MKLVFVFSQKEFTVYVNKTGTVEELLNEAEKEVCVDTCMYMRGNV